jgi:hypothetical protein
MISTRALIPYILITFGLAWAILGLYIFLPDKMNGIFGEITGQHPLIFLSVHAPAIVMWWKIMMVAGGRAKTLLERSYSTN